MLFRSVWEPFCFQRFSAPLPLFGSGSPIERPLELDRLACVATRTERLMVRRIPLRSPERHRHNVVRHGRGHDVPTLDASTVIGMQSAVGPHAADRMPAQPGARVGGPVSVVPPRNGRGSRRLACAATRLAASAHETPAARTGMGRGDGHGASPGRPASCTGLLAALASSHARLHRRPFIRGPLGVRRTTAPGRQLPLLLA